MIDKEGNVRCECGEIADVLVDGRWRCIDCVTGEPMDMSGPPGRNKDR